MRKQTKLVAVLSASALLAIGASMTSFAAGPWVEENGTWVYYEKNGEKATEVWRKSAGMWYWLDENGEMATDTLIEIDNDHYYVDANGVMAVTRWVEIPNEDYDGEDSDEPMNWWYYFGANGKAYRTANSNTNATFKTINGHKYIFDDEGKMLYGWIDGSGVRLTGDSAWQDGVYYCGDEHDGRQRNGEWAYLDIVDTGFELVSDNQSTEFTFDDENQTRWFWFLTNGKKTTNKDNYTINGKKYGFDQYGRMNAEWATQKDNDTHTKSTAPNAASQGNADYTGLFRYYGSPEDGARITRGFFKAVPDYYLDSSDFNDDTERTYYADRNGNLVANKIETISGKKYAFNAYGEMQTGLKAIRNQSDNFHILSSEDAALSYDTEENFKDHINDIQNSTNEYKMYYFGSDGVMKTGKQTVAIDGQSYTFMFYKSGANKGAGVNGPKDQKYYMGGMLLAAERSDKYAVIKKDSTGYTILTTDQFLNEEDGNGNDVCDKLKIPTNEKYDEEYAVTYPSGVEYMLVNTAGTVQKSKTKAKDGDGLCFSVDKNGIITKVYVES